MRNLWPLVKVAAQLLDPDEREAVLGDLAEAGENAWQGLLNVVGLVVRRQTTLWKSWRPWLAAFGLALPGSLLLMGFSLSVSWSWRHLVPTVFPANGPHMGGALFPPVSRPFLLVAWPWTAGFVVGSVSRRTLWVSVASCCLPCLYCLARFQESALPEFCLLLFLVPAAWGVHSGWRTNRIGLPWAIVLAAAITASMSALLPGNTLRGNMSSLT